MDFPFIQVLSKSDFTRQHFVTLPLDHCSRDLQPSTVRVRNEVLSLTVNNTSYAKLGKFFGWWDVYPLPPRTPPELSNQDEFGRISSWGYARVIGSTIDSVPVDSLIFGYLPVGTLAIDLSLSCSKDDQQMLEVSEHRQHLFPIYNRYDVFSPPQAANLSKYYMGWGSLIQTLFKTAWMMNKFMFAFDQRLRVPPSAQAAWGPSDAEIAGSIVILLSGSSKTALSFAHQLRFSRPRSCQPSMVIGVTSPKSKQFSQATGFYDDVLHYECRAVDILEKLKIEPGTKVVLCNFGSRGKALYHWFSALESICKSITVLGIGETPTVESDKELKEKLLINSKLGVIRVNASDLLMAAMTSIGEVEYRDDFLAAWDRFLASGAIPGLSLQWGSDMNSVQSAWDSLCDDTNHAEVGYVFKL